METKATESVVPVLQQFISNRFLNGEAVEPDEKLLGSAVDSLGVLVLADFIEVEFKVRLMDHDLTVENLASLRSIAALVERRRAERS